MEELLGNYFRQLWQLKFYLKDFPGGPVVNNLPTKVGATAMIPGLESSHTPQGN